MKLHSPSALAGAAVCLVATALANAQSLEVLDVLHPAPRAVDVFHPPVPVSSLEYFPVVN